MFLIAQSIPQLIENPVMLQSWRRLTFLHWRYPAEAIRKLLPPLVELDTFDGSAWIGLVPFVVADLQSPHFPKLPWVSQFPETNVRTYVRGPEGERGVWFFTLEADRLAAVVGARLWYHLPYRWAHMQVQTDGDLVRYQSRKNGPFGSGSVDIAVRKGKVIETDDLASFLTARFCLYTVSRGRLLSAPVHHESWLLQAVEVISLKQNVVEGCGVPGPLGEPVAYYSEELDVRVGAIKESRKTSAASSAPPKVSGSFS